MTPIPDKFSRLILIRHGETVGNREQLWTGWSDTPLTEVGWKQIRQTARRFRQDSMEAAALYSSPIERARYTADEIGRAIGIDPILDESLKEMHFGDLEAIRGDSFAVDHPEIYARWRHRTDEDFGWPGGESRREFRLRTVDALERLRIQYLGQTVLLVTHSGFIRMALVHFLPQDYQQWWNVKLNNCGFTHLLIDGKGGAQVPIFNDVAHLTA